MRVRTPWSPRSRSRCENLRTEFHCPNVSYSHNIQNRKKNMEDVLSLLYCYSYFEQSCLSFALKKRNFFSIYFRFPWLNWNHVRNVTGNRTFSISGLFKKLFKDLQSLFPNISKNVFIPIYIFAYKLFDLPFVCLFVCLFVRIL